VSYVLRYAGLMDEATRECDIALSLDSGDYQLRSCALIFDYLGKTDRAMDFLQLDVGTGFVLANLPPHYLRAGKLTEARDSAAKIPPDDKVGPAEKVCVAHQSPSGSTPELDKQVREISSWFLSDPDPENRYWDAALMASCGQKDLALRLLKSAIEGRYCATAVLQTDSLLASLRNTPEFAQLVSASKQCQDKFLAERAQLSH
jgi:hypothetical protein